MTVFDLTQLEPTRVHWKSDRARAGEVRQAHVYWKDHCTRALDNRLKSAVGCLCGCSTHLKSIQVSGNRKRFFSRHEQFDSGFHVLTVNKIA